MSLFTIGWLAWIVFFIILEAVAFRSRGVGNTLSESVWRWFAVRDVNSHGQTPVQVTWVVRLRRFALLAFMAWLTLHFLTGGRF